MRFLCARQAWHDAFVIDYGSQDYAEMAASAGVQKSARGNDGRVIDSCERGLIQHAVQVLKERDAIAYAWGMRAYAPEGWFTMSEQAALLNWARMEFFKENPDLVGWKDDAVRHGKLMILAKIALHDCANEDARGGDSETVQKAHRRSNESMAQAIGVCGKTFKERYERVDLSLRRIYGQLPARALPCVAGVVAAYGQKLAG